MRPVAGGAVALFDVHAAVRRAGLQLPDGQRREQRRRAHERRAGRSELRLRQPHGRGADERRRRRLVPGAETRGVGEHLPPPHLLIPGAVAVTAEGRDLLPQELRRGRGVRRVADSALLRPDRLVAPRAGEFRPDVLVARDAEGPDRLAEELRLRRRVRRMARDALALADRPVDRRRHERASGRAVAVEAQVLAAALLEDVHVGGLVIDVARGARRVLERAVDEFHLGLRALLLVALEARLPPGGAGLEPGDVPAVDAAEDRRPGRNGAQDADTEPSSESGS